MPDPGRRFSDRRADPDGVGPYEFSVGDDFGPDPLPSGGRAILDLREYEENGTVGYYTVLSPPGYDSLEVENRDTSEPIRVEVNEEATQPVPANTIQEMGQQGMYRFTVVNEGSNSIAAGAVRVTVAKEPYGADAQARERRREPALRSVLRNLTGV